MNPVKLATNAVVVTAVTAVTSAVIFASMMGLEASGSAVVTNDYQYSDTATAATSSGNGTQVCPATGCSANSCHATEGGSAGGHGGRPNGGYNTW